MRWTEISPNPDDSAVLQFRRDSVRTAKLTDLDSLENFIAGQIRDRRVLDLGYANHDADTTILLSDRRTELLLNTPPT